MASSSTSSTGKNESNDPCPICLEPLFEEAFLDRCFHAFCYSCIVYWSKLVTQKKSRSSINCPICKTENFSIIHGYTGASFLQDSVHHFGRKSFFSAAHQFRLRCYNAKSRTENALFDVQPYWRTRRYLQKNVWLQNWLIREIQALIQEEDANIIVHHLLGVVESFIRSKEIEGHKSTPDQNRNAFRILLLDAARPFLFSHSEQFVDELEQFLASGLNIEAYDKVCMQQLAMPAFRRTKEHDKEIPGQSLQDPYLQLLCEDSDDAD